MTVHELYLTEYSVKDKAEAIEQGRGFVYLIKNRKVKSLKRTIRYVAEKMVSGHIVNFSEVRSKTLIMVDVDNKSETGAVTGHEDIVKHLLEKSLPPAVITTSLSSTADHPRYHLLFALAAPLDDAEMYKSCVRKLVAVIDEKFGTGTADRASATSMRIFYPGREIVYSDYGAQVSTMNLIMAPDTEADNLADIELDLDSFILDASKVLGIEPVTDAGEKDNSFQLQHGHQILYKTKLKIHCFLSCTGTFRPRQKNSLETAWLGRFQHVENLFSKLLEIDISGVLKKPSGIFFEDIFREHDKDTGRMLRAVITKGKDGRYAYHTYDKDRYVKSYDIYGLVSRLFGLSSVKEAYRMIQAFLKVSGRPLVTCVLRQRIKRNISRLARIGPRNYRFLSRYLSCNGGGLKQVLKKALEKMLETSKTSDMTKSCNQFWITRESLGLEGNVAYNKLHMLLRLGLFEEVEEKSYSGVIKKFLEHRKHKKSGAFVIKIPEYDEVLLEKADAVAEQLLAAGFNESNLCYEGKYDEQAQKIINALCMQRDLFGTEYILLNDFCRKMEPELGLSEKRRLSVIRTIISTVGEGRGIVITTLTSRMQKKYGITAKVYPGVTKIIILSHRKEQINAR